MADGINLGGFTLGGITAGVAAADERQRLARTQGLEEKKFGLEQDKAAMDQMKAWRDTSLAAFKDASTLIEDHFAKGGKGSDIPRPYLIAAATAIENLDLLGQVSPAFAKEAAGLRATLQAQVQRASDLEEKAITTGKAEGAKATAAAPGLAASEAAKTTAQKQAELAVTTSPEAIAASAKKVGAEAAAREAAKVREPSINRIVAPILQKVAAGQAPTTGEQTVLDYYQRLGALDMLLRQAATGQPLPGVAPAAPSAPTGEVLPEGVPAGSKLIGMTNGNPVYESPDGRRFEVRP